ncbi:bifunctional diguanylate cyclase/phosphodiesterase [Acholeplasma equirhinis]|uniref:bifunctional diguanylate cyclase/phosphodiesterase n=1 Tax=Acholeplasma equirhinis TaxID=555393 RepID=UPI00197A989F|nr:bifunctional diguanylate cyclase/phosphodiesterase [Acholeplasma equirhinis]MBN3490003.1 bifunctional diguanylate cyclase/phosphodiesterase [Acholeplasma equirhinis]
MEIFLTILVTLILIGLIIGLYFVLKHELRKYRDEKLLVSDEVVPLSTLTNLVDRMIKRNTKKAKPFTLMLIDLDQYQDIVDAFNEEEERLIMQYVSNHIKTALPEESVISQGVKPDQFYIFIPDSFDHSNILNLAKHIKRESQRKVSILDGVEIKKTVSIGIATFPLHGNTKDLLFQALDIAMYIVKKNGGNGIKYYSEELSQGKEYLDLYHEIREAIEKEEFIYFYQPIVSTSDTKDIYGVEALLRWQHPKRGLLAPQSFIGLAEQSGELDAIGIWGVEQALLLLTDLSQLYHMHNLVVNINVSPRQILNEETFTIFQRLILKHRAKPEMVAIEIPDFSTYKNNETFMRNLIKIKTLGFQIAIDLSTTDYDVLDLVERFKIDMIKLNRDFFKLEENYNKRKYIQMLIDFVKAKELKLVAEGVETEAQLQELYTKGVGYAQGYFIAKPLDQTQLSAFLTQK